MKSISLKGSTCRNWKTHYYKCQKKLKNNIKQSGYIYHQSLVSYQLQVSCSFKVLCNSACFFNFLKLYCCRGFHIACGYPVFRKFLPIHCILSGIFMSSFSPKACFLIIFWSNFWHSFQPSSKLFLGQPLPPLLSHESNLGCLHLSPEWLQEIPNLSYCFSSHLIFNINSTGTFRKHIWSCQFLVQIYKLNMWKWTC